MIIAMLAALFLVGGGSSGALLESITAIDDGIKTYVEDPQARDAARDVVNSMEDTTKQFGSLSSDTLDALKNVMEDPSATDADIDSIWNKYFDGTTQFNLEMVDRRFDLKEHITREEWAQIFAGLPE